MRRRQALQALGATGIALLAGCGTEDETASQTLSLALLFDATHLAAGRPERLTFGVVDDGTLSLGSGGEVTVRLVGDEGLIDEQVLEGRVVAHDHPEGDDVHEHDSVVRYFAMRTVFPTAGAYAMSVELEGQTTEVMLPVQAAGASPLPGAGDRMPAVHTPTPSEGLGVDPICTRQPPCSLHESDFAGLVGSGVPVALLIATPAFCQTTFCGPVLDVLLDAAEEFPDVSAVHAEVYSNPTGPGGLNNPDLRPSPTMTDLGLTFEPTLFLVDGEGVVQERIDNVFDDVELRAALERLSG